jgi:hypothetical protein
MFIKVGPVGGIVQGDVLDVSVKSFQRVLKDYDSQLYVKWNPRKLKGHGCWEIRRTPTYKTAVPVGEIDGVMILDMKTLEFSDIHHVLDCAFLNYDAMNKIKRMDTSNTKNWVAQLEAREKERVEQMQAKAKEELKYAIKQQKSATSQFYEMVRSGINPAEVILSTEWVLNK